MRSVPVLACAALCLLAGGARADGGAQVATDAEVAPTPARQDPPRWGLLTGGGFPEGLAADVVFRPVSEVRLYAGPMWNYVGWGLQGGVTLVPWHLGVSPLLSLEAGRYFSADATFLAGKAGGVPADVEPLLRHVAYDYAALRIGVEIGTRDAFAITVEAGLSYVSLTASGTATSQVDVGGGTVATVAFTDPHLRGTMPSVKVGVQLWF